MGEEEFLRTKAVTQPQIYGMAFCATAWMLFKLFAGIWNCDEEDLDDQFVFNIWTLV